MCNDLRRRKGENRVTERTACATKVSIRTVRRVRAEYIKNECHFLTPVKRYTVSRLRDNPDGFDRAALRRTVHEFYDRQDYPTLSLVLDAAKE